MNKHEAAPDSSSMTDTFQQAISHCLCPEGFDVILDLDHLDLSQPHQHKRFQKNDIYLAPSTYGNLQSNLRAQMRIVPPEEYSRLWLELTKCWLFTCPIDPEYYLEDETGKELYCQKLRSELVARILNFN